MKERNSKKKMWLSLGLAGALTVGATLALFTDFTETLTNAFNIYGGAGNKGINITIKEHDLNNDADYKIDASNQNKWVEGDDEATASVTYNDLISYQIIDKDPTVFVDNKSVESVIVLAVTGLDENSSKIKPYATSADTGYNTVNGLSSEWTEITVTNGDTGTRYFTYEYTNDKFDVLDKNTITEGKGDNAVTYRLLPAIFKHLQVQDVADGTVFNEITAKAAAAQIENLTTADQKHDAVVEALRQFNENITDYDVKE